MHMQNGILNALPAHATYLTFSVKAGVDADVVLAALANLSPLVDGERIVLGLGASLLAALDTEVPGLREFSGIAGSRVPLPCTPAAVWCWLREQERGALVHQMRRVQAALGAAFEVQQVLDGFKYDSGRDLTGYQDGTENPREQAAVAAAIVQGQGAGLDGGSMVAVQQWLHRFDQFDALPAAEQDRAIGRRKSDNEELDDAPASAHVKRTAQENFVPEAFVVRRSMPWAGQGQAGLQFVAFGKSFDAFEAQLRRMSGAEDGVVDALFKFSHPISGSYFWCPPLQDGRLDLSVIRVSR